jgi:tryptophan-rich sensory protein
MKNKWLKRLLCLAVPLGAGFLSGMLIKNDAEIYQRLNLPAFAPPSVVFRIVWPVLYIMMGVSLYLIIEKAGKSGLHAVLLFAFQLILNIAWPVVFFKFELFFAFSSANLF